MRNARDNIVIGIMIIMTYFLIYAFMGNSQLLNNLGGLPLIQCVYSLINMGFNAATFRGLIKDFAQMIVTVYVIVVVQNLLPYNNNRRIGATIGAIVGYIILYLISMWLVRYVVFTNIASEIVKMFISIFAVAVSGVGAMIVGPLRGVFSNRLFRNYLVNYAMNSRLVHWLANAFFIASVILFLAIAIEMTIGLSYFFGTLVVGIPAIITLIVMLMLLVVMIRI